jgi:hypothetical protein
MFKGLREDWVKIVEQEDMELTITYRHIKNTSTCGIIFTAYLLNTARRPLTAKKARKSQCNWVGKRKARKESRWDLHP